MSNNGWEWYAPSRPIAVEGGIKARSKRGAIGETWWSQRFIEVLESFHLGTRLTRGKNYARRGQVIDLFVEPGAATAQVQGSRSRPYRVRIGLQPFGKADWAKVTEALAADAWYAAKLLAGEMPTGIIDLFADLGLSLFPAQAADLPMDCSCPDWSVPCKHIAATFYLLAERFDEDPFEILAWRGRDREELLNAISATRSGGAVGDRREAAPALTPLTDCLDTYWTMPPLPPREGAPIVPVDALLTEAPAVPLTVRGIGLAAAFLPAYRAADPHRGDEP
ncbi:MAG: SWIM zinc finger family protein [Bifidobacteriaceae bacterium]|jgi:uncharacterized Zn finger protein|nr:SWIM zinc finger family protein [Bifidobacteriaceae bacterium]